MALPSLGPHRQDQMCKIIPNFQKSSIFSIPLSYEKNKCMVMKSRLKIVKFKASLSGVQALGWGQYSLKLIIVNY